MTERRQYELTHMAQELMAEHGLLPGWQFRWDSARRRFGYCHYSRRVISISAPLAALNSDAEVRQTLLHEIAHALVGSDVGHGVVWQRRCLAIGGNGERLYSTDTVKTPPRKWSASCPVCGKTFQRHRVPQRRPLWCVCAFNRTKPDHSKVLVWRANA